MTSKRGKKHKKEGIETIKIGRWDIPKSLFNEYVKFRTLADAYALKDPKVMREGLMHEWEAAMRWQMCVQKVMELHREICKAINVPYSEDPKDEFYITFLREVDRRVKRFHED